MAILSFTVQYPITIRYHKITSFRPNAKLSFYHNLIIGLPRARGVLGLGWFEAYSRPTCLQSRLISGPCSRCGLSAWPETSHLVGRVWPGFLPLFFSFLTTYLGKSVTNCLPNLFGSGQGKAGFQTFYQLIKAPDLY